MKGNSENLDGLKPPQRHWATAVIWLGIVMSVIDISIANIALPTIAKDLGASPTDSIWVINAYQIAIVMALLPLAALGEILTFRKVYLAGFSVFALASLGCALSNDLTGLVLMRFAQGLGAAGLMAMNGALVRSIYPSAILGRGLGYNALVVALASVLGPSASSAILAIFSWQWLFAINVPVALLAIPIGLRFLPRTSPVVGSFDVVSALLCVISFAAFFLAGSDLAEGQYSARVASEVALTLIGTALLVRRCLGRSQPLLPLDLIGIPILRLSYATSICAFAAYMMVMIALPFYLEQALDVDQLAIGLLITPFPIGLAIAAPLAGRMVEHISAATLGGMGLMATAVGFAGLTLAPAAHPTALIVFSMFLSGFGFGFFQVLNNRTMLSNAPSDRSGAAGGMLALSRICGFTAGGIAAAFSFHLAGPASNLSLIIAAGIGLVASLLSFRRLNM